MGLVPQFRLPFALPPGSRVLVAGCGGGYDIVCALPVVFALRAEGHTVHLANYSFTELERTQGCANPVDGVYCVCKHAQPDAERPYFPELYLSRWWHDAFGEEQAIWAFSRIGVRPLSAGYQYLQQTLDLNAVVVVDGGVDGLFIGDEFDMGSPSMDACSILSAASLSNCIGIFAFTAFGTEGTAYSVRHADALLRISELVARRGFLGVSAASLGTVEAQRFLSAVESVHSATREVWHSNMASSIAAAIRGRFGETAVTVKTEMNRVWVSPLTLLYWYFDLEAVAAAKPYREEVLQAETVGDVYLAIEKVRERLGVRARCDIPI
ncbi:MAG: DUF1152 domain-containing protein [Candidatus Xenobia bacterium]